MADLYAGRAEDETLSNSKTEYTILHKKVKEGENFSSDTENYKRKDSSEESTYIYYSYYSTQKGQVH